MVVEAHAKVSTAKKVPQSADLQSSTAKKPHGAASFAVLDDLDDEPDFDDFAGLDAADWRIERRYRRRKDGKLIMYFNYRLRKVMRDEEGNRIIKYRKGGSREI